MEATFCVFFLSARYCYFLDAAIWLTIAGAGQDKAQHFIASAMLSAAGNEYAQHQGMSRDRSATFGLMFSVGLGASKELWDSRPEGSGWSWKDFTWDVAGATTGYTVWQLAHN
ncbi:lipoprotein [Escherichia coli]|uniref:Lipoprotein n=4 Tax=Escherichia coli TaxID=562 RepID=A0A376SBE6_ECOLX|nr:lipoprotein [Escherichia coli]